MRTIWPIDEWRQKENPKFSLRHDCAIAPSIFPLPLSMSLSCGASLRLAGPPGQTILLCAIHKSFRTLHCLPNDMKLCVSLTHVACIIVLAASGLQCDGVHVSVARSRQAFTATSAQNHGHFDTFHGHIPKIYIFHAF
jgi:hypothetical protein